MWKTAKNFSDLQRCMIKFLNGKYGQSPWSFAKVDSETVPTLANLVKIIRKGFVTISSQPGTITYDNQAMNGELYTESQRGYMEGFMLTKNVKPFVERLLATGKVAVYTESLNYDIQVFGVTPDMYVPSEDEEHLISLTQEIIPSIHVNYYTNFRVNLPPGFCGTRVGNINPALRSYLQRMCCYVTVIMKQQGDTCIDRLVLECMP